MDENQDRNGKAGVPGCLLKTPFQQSSIFIELDGGSGDVTVNGPQVPNKFLLLFALPNILFGINLDQQLAIPADEPAVQCWRQILSPHRTAIILVFDRIKGFTHIVEEVL